MFLPQVSQIESMTREESMERFHWFFCVYVSDFPWRYASGKCHHGPRILRSPGQSLKTNSSLMNIGAAGAVALTAGLQETFAPGQHRRRGGTGTGVTDAVLIEPKSRQTAAKPWRMRRRRRKNVVRIFGSGGSEKMAWRNQHRRTTSVRELCLALAAGLQETFAPGQHRRRRGTGTGVTDAVLIEPKSRQTAAKPWRMRRRGRKNVVRISDLVGVRRWPGGINIGAQHLCWSSGLDGRAARDFCSRTTSATPRHRHRGHRCCFDRAKVASNCRQALEDAKKGKKERGEDFRIWWE